MLTTGFDSIDSLSVFRPGSLTIITGELRSGKTTVARHIARHSPSAHYLDAGSLSLQQILAFARLHRGAPLIIDHYSSPGEPACHLASLHLKQIALETTSPLFVTSAEDYLSGHYGPSPLHADSLWILLRSWRTLAQRFDFPDALLLITDAQTGRQHLALDVHIDDRKHIVTKK